MIRTVNPCYLPSESFEELASFDRFSGGKASYRIITRGPQRFVELRVSRPRRSDVWLNIPTRELEGAIAALENARRILVDEEGRS